MKKKLLTAIIIIIPAVLAILCFAMLPEEVCTQVGSGMQKQNIMNKYIAVLTPTLICAGGIVLSFKNSSVKNIFVYCVGIFCYIMLLVFNL